MIFDKKRWEHGFWFYNMVWKWMVSVFLSKRYWYLPLSMAFDPFPSAFFVNREVRRSWDYTNGETWVLWPRYNCKGLPVPSFSYLHPVYVSLPVFLRPFFVSLRVFPRPVSVFLRSYDQSYFWSVRIDWFLKSRLTLIRRCSDSKASSSTDLIFSSLVAFNFRCLVDSKYCCKWCGSELYSWVICADI